eukprot:CAMPEP_0204194662 /NCGR_PEP_ID=MMETSP0361-20130328/62517_1 /ASSEMBLY_ACC=CAM_ASM_000343 /TAXON_ID=268821 /ORGANISM="Scrippsiella Hangoei, Strain SHTV-5" /LENGTH=502 /DNA_ID=CAMNT_0051156073 /DNA_START=32 /DNA_END=1540 /DNA_ORIENTATION=+
MINYNHGRWGVGFIWQLQGSVFPKALIWAAPAAMLSIIVNLIKQSAFMKTEVGFEASSASSVLTAFSSFITVLGFMVVFRSNQAWGRYWQGAQLVQQMRGEWFNATSSLFAFTSRKPEKQRQVEKFEADLVRLMSLLFGTALGSLSGCNPDLLDQDGLSPASADFLANCSSNGQELRCEVILQWIQRFVVLNCDSQVIDIQPPILSRVFQGLASGVVHLATARKINELPFPFHYAQMLAVMLLTYTVGVAIAAGFVMHAWWAAGGATFFNVLVLWSVNYTAAEIEQPFGADDNDLPIALEMHRMNDLLKTLLHAEAKIPPAYADKIENVGPFCPFSVASEASMVVVGTMGRLRNSECIPVEELTQQGSSWEPVPPASPYGRMSMFGGSVSPRRVSKGSGAAEGEAGSPRKGSKDSSTAEGRQGSPPARGAGKNARNESPRSCEGAQGESVCFPSTSREEKDQDVRLSVDGRAFALILPPAKGPSTSATEEIEIMGPLIFMGV